MPTIRTLAAAALLALLLLPRPAGAQEGEEEPVLPAPGTRSLNLRLDSGSSMAGIGRMTDPRTRVELGVGLRVLRVRGGSGGEDRTEVERSTELRLGVRRYAAAEERIVPFLLAAATGSHHRRTFEADGFGAPSVNTSIRGFGLGLEAGGGVEWFPVARVGVSGEAGVAAHVSRYRASAASGQEPPRTMTQSSAGLRTFTSALGVALYF